MALRSSPRASASKLAMFRLPCGAALDHEPVEARGNRGTIYWLSGGTNPLRRAFTHRVGV
jgi:hypothetical protein